MDADFRLTAIRMRATSSATIGDPSGRWSRRCSRRRQPSAPHVPVPDTLSSGSSYPRAADVLTIATSRRTGLHTTRSDLVVEAGRLQGRRMALAVAVSGTLVLGLALRLGGLDRKSVWFDEAVSAGFAALPVPDLLAASANDVNLPLYYLLLHFWLPLATNDLWLRLPSAVFGSAAILLTVLLGRAMLPWPAALMAGALTALSAFHIDMSQEARSYGLFSMLATGSLWLLLRAEDSQRRRDWLAFSVVTGLALYCHNYAFFLVLAEALYIAVRMLASRCWRPRAVAAFALAGALFLPWVPALVGQLGLVHGDYWIHPPDTGVLWETYYAFIVYTPPGHGWGTDLLERAARWGILALLALGVVSIRRQPRGALVVLALGVPLAAAISISVWITPIYVSRYLVFAVPAFWLSVVAGLQMLPFPSVRLIFAVLIGAALAANLPPLYGDPFYARPDLRAAAQDVLSGAEP